WKRPRCGALSASMCALGWRPARGSATRRWKHTPIDLADRAPGSRGELHDLSVDAMRTSRLVHRLRHRVMIAVGDRDHAPSRTAECRPQRAGLFRRRDDVVEVGIGTGAAWLMQPVVHGASDQGAIAL